MGNTPTYLPLISILKVVADAASGDAADASVRVNSGVHSLRWCRAKSDFTLIVPHFKFRVDGE